ncbi:MAG: hypothetical protein AAB593_02005 [Patescibacteria group bacterium]
MKLKSKLNDELFLIKYIIRASIILIIISSILFIISGWKNDVDRDYFDKIDVTNKLVSKIDAVRLNVEFSDFASAEYDDDLMRQAYDYKLQSDNRTFKNQNEKDEELQSINKDNFFVKIGAPNVINNLNNEVSNASENSKYLGTIQIILFLFLTVVQIVNLFLASKLSLMKIIKQKQVLLAADPQEQ